MRIDFNLHPVLDVKRGEIIWLGLVAFTKVLKRKETRHKELLALLKDKLLKYNWAESFSSALEYAVDDSHSSVIWKIRY